MTDNSKQVSRLRWRRAIALGVLGALCLAFLLILPNLLGLIPRRVTRTGIDLFLNIFLIVHPIGWLLGLLGAPLAFFLLVRARKRGTSGLSGARSRPWLMKAFVFSLACVFGSIALEAGAAGWRAWTAIPPELPHWPDLPQQLSSANGDKTIRLLVLGESSAEGENYQPWLSVGQIAAWQIERALPGQKVQTEIAAFGGASLESMHKLLPLIHQRPDAVIIYSGHNEFQAHYAWDRSVPIGDDAPIRLTEQPLAWLIERSSVQQLIMKAQEANRVDVLPPPLPSRGLVDLPNHRGSEFALKLETFEARLEAMVSSFERIHALVILIIPSSNDGGYEPDRSVPSRPLGAAEKESLERAFHAARDLEQNPAEALRRYEAILSDHPHFAEAHFRMARLLEQQGHYKEAHDHYVSARDDDGQILRCPSAFQEAYRRVARRHPGCLLLDSQAELEAVSAHGILDDKLFNDGQHPTLVGYSAIANALLRDLRVRRAFGWDRGSAPVVAPIDCARNFGMDVDKWIEVCKRSQKFFIRTANIRYDSRERSAHSLLYAKAIEKLKAGVPPERTGVPGLDVSTAGLRWPVRNGG